MRIQTEVVGKFCRTKDFGLCPYVDCPMDVFWVCRFFPFKILKEGICNGAGHYPLRCSKCLARDNKEVK